MVVVSAKMRTREWQKWEQWIGRYGLGFRLPCGRDCLVTRAMLVICGGLRCVGQGISADSWWFDGSSIWTIVPTWDLYVYLRICILIHLTYVGSYQSNSQFMYYKLVLSLFSSTSQMRKLCPDCVQIVYCVNSFWRRTTVCLVDAGHYHRQVFSPGHAPALGAGSRIFLLQTYVAFFAFTIWLSVVPTYTPRELTNIYTKGMERCVCSIRSVLCQGFSLSLARGGCRSGQLRGAFEHHPKINYLP